MQVFAMLLQHNLVIYSDDKPAQFPSNTAENTFKSQREGFDSAEVAVMALE